MNIITEKDILKLNISPSKSIDWVKEAFSLKSRCQLPPKISLHPQGNDFFNTMPCILPPEYHTFGCKVVSRVEGQHPALNSEMMVFDTKTGKMTALVNTDWITTRRTGAVAVLAIQTLQNSHAYIYSFIGLGAIGQSVLECFLAVNQGRDITIRLKRYKDHAEKTIERFSKDNPNVKFVIADTMEDFIKDSDVIVSSITYADGILVDNINLFKPGVLVVPVHTRGFQNCDTVFDKVFADDEGHVKGFKYFNQFKKFGEIGDVLSGNISGRETDEERILSYNIGLGLHDIYFVSQILQNLK